MKHAGVIRPLIAAVAMLVLATGSVASAEQNQSGGPTSAPTHTVPAKPQQAGARPEIVKDKDTQASSEKLVIKTKSTPAAAPASSPIEERKANPAATKPTCPPGWQLYGVGNPVKEWKCRPKNADPR